jgi:hypothetical protein
MITMDRGSSILKVAGVIAALSIAPLLMTSPASAYDYAHGKKLHHVRNAHARYVGEYDGGTPVFVPGVPIDFAGTAYGPGYHWCGGAGLAGTPVLCDDPAR